MLNSIRIFIKVVEVGSFSKAARILNMAPSSITRSIDALEKELKVTLLQRSTRQLTLTDKGIQFLDGATQLIADSNLLFESLREDKREPEGLLRISVLESFGRIHISPLLSGFLNKYPKVKVEIELENKLIDLSSQNVDLGIRVGEPADSDLKARVLLSNHNVLCASPDYFKENGLPQIPSDLSNHNCLLLKQDKKRVFWYFKKGRTQNKIHVQGNLSSRGGTPLVEAALNGAGIVQLANWAIIDHIKEGRLITCLQDWQASFSEKTAGEVYVVYKNNKYPNPLIRLFIDYLLENIQNNVATF